MGSIVFHGVEIPETLLAQEALNHAAASGAEARAAAGHALATKALLLRRAAELGLVPEPELDEDGRPETPEAALVRAVLDAEIDVKTPTEAECRRIYDQQPARFTSSPIIEAAHILIAPQADSADGWTEARIAAEAVVVQLADAPDRFETLAARLSACPSASVGGSLGQLQPGDLVAEVEAELSRLAPGTIGEAPVRSRFGWHVLKLVRRDLGRTLPFEVAVENIRMHLESRAWSAAAAGYVKSLAAKARAEGVAITMTDDGELKPGSGCLGDLVGDQMTPERLAGWLEASDPLLSQQVQAAAEAAGVSPAEFVRSTAAKFINGADDDAWTQLISAAQGSVDPALAAFAAIMKSAFPAPPRRQNLNFEIHRRRDGM